MTSGREWVESIEPLGTRRAEVMKAVIKAVDDGMVVDWPMQPVTVADITFYAAADYFSIGEPTDFVRVPLDPMTAIEIADKLGYFSMPTARMVDLIWAAADTKLEPRPMGPPKYPYNSSMFSVERFKIHNEWIEGQLIAIAEHFPVSQIVAGHKKDIVLSNRLIGKPGRLAFYGWHRTNGTAIQGPYVNVNAHIDTYWDYSHGWRAIGKMVKVNGLEMPIAELLQDELLCKPLCEEQLRSGQVDPGPLRVLRYPPPDEVTSRPAPIVEAPMTRTPDHDPDSIVADSFVQAKNFTWHAEGRRVDWVVLHSMEAAEHACTAENVATWFAGKYTAAPRASAHYNVDCDSIVQSVREKDIAWHAPGANRAGIGIEHAGYANQMDDEYGWQDDYSKQMLERSAKLCADICKRHNIPVAFVDENGLRQGHRGITYHHCVSKAWKRSTHVDPGKNFPINWYLDKVRSLLV